MQSNAAGDIRVVDRGAGDLCAVLRSAVVSSDVDHGAHDSHAPRAGRGRSLPAGACRWLPEPVGRRPWGRGLGEGLAERLGVGGLVGDRGPT